MKFTASASGKFEASLKLENAARIALDSLTVELDPSTGKPKVRVSASQNLNNLKLKPSVTLKAAASITGEYFYLIQVLPVRKKSFMGESMLFISFTDD